MITSHENRDLPSIWHVSSKKTPASLAVEQKQHLQKPEKHTEIFDNANFESSDV